MDVICGETPEQVPNSTKEDKREMERWRKRERAPFSQRISSLAYVVVVLVLVGGIISSAGLSPYLCES